MKIFCKAILFVLPACLSAQMKHDAAPDGSMEAMHHAAPVASTSLTVTGPDGKTQTYSTEDLRGMAHLTVKVHNAHSNADESYSGVPVSELAKRAEPKLVTGDKPKIKPLMMVLVFGGTDNYHVVLTMCDVDPSCRNGMAIVADQQDGKSITTDGDFKLIVTEDKKPQRWVRNLSSITLKTID
jgi:hypothetical protein